MKPGIKDFWTVIVFYEGGNWLAWTYGVLKLAEDRLLSEQRHQGSTGYLIPLEVKHG